MYCARPPPTVEPELLSSPFFLYGSLTHAHLVFDARALEMGGGQVHEVLVRSLGCVQNMGDA